MEAINEILRIENLYSPEFIKIIVVKSKVSKLIIYFLSKNTMFRLEKMLDNVDIKGLLTWLKENYITKIKNIMKLDVGDVEVEEIRKSDDFIVVFKAKNRSCYNAFHYTIKNNYLEVSLRLKNFLFY